MQHFRNSHDSKKNEQRRAPKAGETHVPVSRAGNYRLPNPTFNLVRKDRERLLLDWPTIAETCGKKQCSDGEADSDNEN
jgi:hypothetical protein